MAVDTRNKRSSAIGMMRPWMVRLPLADATIDAADRKHVAYSYAGIAAQAFTSIISRILLVGSYSPTISMFGTYAPTVSAFGSYSPQITLYGYSQE